MDCMVDKKLSYPKKIPHWISNHEVFSRGKKFIPKYNPANGKKIADVTRGTKKDTKQAIDLAEQAFPSWMNSSIMARAEIIRKATYYIEAHKEEIAEILTLETGRSKKDVLGEVRSAVEYGFYWSSEAKRFFGLTTTSSNPNRSAYMVRSPIGVCALITPFNGPFSGMAKKIYPALLCGNTIVLKSHELTPFTAIWLAMVLKEVGLEKNIFQVIQGLGSEAGAGIVEDKRIGLISFTGSVATGKYLLKSAADRIGKVCLELGGKNPMVICDDADLEHAAKTAVASAFIEAGQRCAAASRIIIFESVYKQFRELLIEKTLKLKVGSSDVDEICPLISQKRLDEVLAIISRAVKQGAKILIGGKTLTDSIHKDGYYIEPTILDNVFAKDEISRKEVFGPVVCLYKVKDFDQAVEFANDCDFGLTSAIHTKNIDRAHVFTKLSQVGVVRVNGPTHGSENHMPFGGIKLSGNGFREPGINALDIYSEWKFITFDYNPQKV